MKEVKPHKWAKEIIAWANGAKIERRESTISNSKWSITTRPDWNNNYWEFRVYDPLREVKEAFEEGKVIQYRNTNRYDNPDWIDWEINYGGLPAWHFQPEWRIKPDNKLEVGKDYISIDEGWLVINRSGDEGNLGFTKLGVAFRYDLFCSTPEEWQEATEEEVKKFFGCHLIKRYGEDWNNVKIKECMQHGIKPIVNIGGFMVGIVKTSQGWRVWNKNGCLFYKGKWAEVLEEEEIGFDNWKICDYSGERVFRHIGSRTDLKWRRATKQEVLSAPNYDGTATHQDFPFEAGDKVIARWAERPEVLTLKESVGKHKFKYKECGEGSYVDAGTDTWCYATEQEINIPKKVEYVPFEEKDKEQLRGKWIRKKDGNIEMKITSFETLSTNIFLIEGKYSKYLFENFTFLDGTPFGKIEQ